MLILKSCKSWFRQLYGGISQKAFRGELSIKQFAKAEIMKDKLKFLKLIVHSETPPECGITCLCGGYELKEWRYNQFADWLFDNHPFRFCFNAFCP